MLSFQIFFIPKPHSILFLISKIFSLSLRGKSFLKSRFFRIQKKCLIFTQKKQKSNMNLDQENYLKSEPLQSKKIFCTAHFTLKMGAWPYLSSQSSVTNPDHLQNSNVTKTQCCWLCIFLHCFRKILKSTYIASSSKTTLHVGFFPALWNVY